jgi:hypothetical protein
MNTHHSEEQARLRMLVTEGIGLADLRPKCHYMANELMATVLIAKMHESGFDVSIADAEECVNRMRVAIQTGAYPMELLQESKRASELLTVSHG